MKTRKAVFLFGLWTLLAATPWAQDKNPGNLAQEPVGSKSVQNPCPPEKACDRSQTLTPTLAGQAL